MLTPIIMGFQSSFCDPDMSGCMNSPICNPASALLEKTYQIDSDWEYDGGTCSSISIRPKVGSPSENESYINIGDGSRKIVKNGKTLWDVSSKPTTLTMIIGAAVVVATLIVLKGAA